MANNNNNNNHKNNNKLAQKKRVQQHTKQIKQQLKETVETGLIDGVFVYTKPLSMSDFAKEVNKPITEIIKYYFSQGMMLNQNTTLSDEQMGELALHFGFDFKKEQNLTKENIFEQFQTPDKPEDLKVRPPVVTIMGHVDHGKTTLLDSMHNSNVVSGEAGGITQAIGAYQVTSKSGKKITFIDTPGHEAFTEMRSRGANVTDIVILIVAADDGVMPQTEEAIDHAKQAGVPIIVFVNKMDKPGADPERVKTELMRHGILAEDFGGDVPFIYGSAKQKQGLEELQETILLIAELKDYKSNPNKFASGVVLEAHLDKSKGPVASVLVQHGTLNLRDVVIAGTTHGTIKDMENEVGKKQKTAIPSQPVLIIGLNEVPHAGDKFLVMNDEKVARSIAEAQLHQFVERERSNKQIFTLDSIKTHIDDGEMKLINLIIKADTQGSVEALKSSLAKVNIDGVRINIIRASVGAISNSDITLAAAGQALVYGFNVRPAAPVRKKAEEDGVEIRLHNIIYKLIEELQAAAKGMLDPIMEEKILGQAEIRALFRHTDIGVIGGFHVIDGMIPRNGKIRVIRGGVVIYTGEILSLKHGKEDIKEAKIDSEGGLTIKNFKDLKEQDIIEAYVVEEKKAT
ncbi:translation initiation factor IF-2 [Williamsoniiplasma luminosum]|uniref:Translation initiation factor IF-2 n=1 Tax=Williamsoniiplasma luminosum TaxID=214888 RepID=A0A2K8NTV7_9MOLU|nr:translation initiation factor IF-2 [Williamsoniiplasma luminosum]ATZ17194.1 translation initiation factor IF-2 [Williamsoniiplasma luminosum]